MGNRTPYGYGPNPPGWPIDPQDASTWPSDGRTRTYAPDPTYPSWPVYPPPEATRPSRPVYSPKPTVPVAPPSQPQRVVYIVQQPSTPVIVEVIGGLLGFYGIGWLVGGYAVTGIVLLTGSLLLAGIWAIVAIATVGVGLFCIIPINLVLLLASTLTLNSRLKRKLMRRLGQPVRA